MASMPAAKSAKVSGAKVPNILNHADGSCTITHSEFVQDVTSGSSGGGSVLYLPVNPQRATVFTWLSAIATRYEMYRFERIKFTYRPSIGTTVSGWVVLGFDFDAYDVPDVQPTEELYPSKAEMLAWKYSAKSAVWQECHLDLSADSRISTYRYCDIGTRGDIRLDILGNLFVRSLTAGSTLSCGELFVEYTIRFRQPAYKIPPALYSTIGNFSPNWVGLNDWFPVGVPIAGNLSVSRVDGSKLLIRDVGEFLIAIILNATANITGSPTVTFSAPAASPSANWESAVKSGNSNSLGATSLYRLRVETPPVLATFNQGSGTNISSQVLFSTYKP